MKVRNFCVEGGNRNFSNQALAPGLYHLNLSVLSHKLLENICMALKPCAAVGILLQLLRQEIVLSTIPGKIVRLSCLA